jgi:hypothetical protein
MWFFYKQGSIRYLMLIFWESFRKIIYCFHYLFSKWSRLLVTGFEEIFESTTALSLFNETGWRLFYKQLSSDASILFCCWVFTCAESSGQKPMFSGLCKEYLAVQQHQNEVGGCCWLPPPFSVAQTSLD